MTMNFTDERKRQAEEQIREKQRTVDYNTLEYTVELLVQKYLGGIENDENEIFIPDYQREFVWKDDRKSKFIESVILGIPIPYIFTASLKKDIDDDLGRVEVVDGSQRIRTLASFTKNEFRLVGLEKLNHLNDFLFSDLDISRQRKILRRPIRVIELSEKADEEVRRDMFERINTGSDELTDMEKRKGIFSGPFYGFLRDCSQIPLFKELCPLSDAKSKREEGPELVLRFFAYREGYTKYTGDVGPFLNEYMKEMSKEFDASYLLHIFTTMLNFVKDNFPLGFRKGYNNKSVPRMRFEAISVGTSLALESGKSLNTSDIPIWLESREFKSLTQDDAGNRPQRLKGRIEFVKEALLRNA